MIGNILIPFILSALFSGPTSINYQITEDSKLYLNGSTNITDFKCKCLEKFSKNTIVAEYNSHSKHIDFHNAKLKIKTTSLDCKNRLLNKDLYSSLKAEHNPYIQLDVLNALPKRSIKSIEINKPYDYTAVTVINIAGKPVAQVLDVVITKLENNKIKLQSNKPISMKEYNITPVTPIKMIKIDDKVSINFELVVEII